MKQWFRHCFFVRRYETRLRSFGLESCRKFDPNSGNAVFSLSKTRKPIPLVWVKLLLHWIIVNYYYIFYQLHSYQKRTNILNFTTALLSLFGYKVCTMFKQILPAVFLFVLVRREFDHWPPTRNLQPKLAVVFLKTFHKKHPLSLLLLFTF